MYRFNVFARSISLLFLSLVLLNGAYAIASDETVLAINPTVFDDLTQDGVKANTTNTDNPPMSQMKDLNADGILDFITTYAKSGGISIALGAGNGKFQPPVHYLTGNQPLSATIMDCNGDNLLDVVAYNVKQNSVAVLLGDGKGNFAEQKMLPMSFISASLQNEQSKPASSDTSVVSKALSEIAALEQSDPRHE